MIQLLGRSSGRHILFVNHDQISDLEVRLFAALGDEPFGSPNLGFQNIFPKSFTCAFLDIF